MNHALPPRDAMRAGYVPTWSGLPSVAMLQKKMTNAIPQYNVDSLRVTETSKPSPRNMACDSTGNIEPSLLARTFLEGGGLIAGDALAEHLRNRIDQPISLLARWIVKGEIVWFLLESQTMIPLFQIDMTLGRPRKITSDIIKELKDAFCEQEIAEWFVRPNSWLAGQSPLQHLAKDEDGVFQAARADRFVALG